MPVKWKIEFDKSVVINNFDRKGWIKTDGEDWNVYW